MARVIRDDVAEVMGAKSTVGEGVEIVILLPPNTKVVMSNGELSTDGHTKYPVYLVNATFSRVFKTDTFGIPVGDPVPAVVTAMVDGVTYVGNELFSPEELEVEA